MNAWNHFHTNLLRDGLSYLIDEEIRRSDGSYYQRATIISPNNERLQVLALLRGDERGSFDLWILKGTPSQIAGVNAAITEEMVRRVMVSA